MPLSNDQLIEIKGWFTRRIENLVRDSYRAFTDKIVIDHSLGGGAAPFPIVLFCMGTLDFFSAAHFGYSEKKRRKERLNQTERMTKFLEKYLSYDEAVSNVALDVFRHKLVHLAEPYVQTSHHKNNILGWEIASVQAEGYHWSIKDYDSKGNKIVRFGVANFINDLKEGVLGTTSYYQDLTTNTNLQENYLSFFKELLAG